MYQRLNFNGLLLMDIYINCLHKKLKKNIYLFYFDREYYFFSKKTRKKFKSQQTLKSLKDPVK